MTIICTATHTPTGQKHIYVSEKLNLDTNCNASCILYLAHLTAVGMAINIMYPHDPDELTESYERDPLSLSPEELAKISELLKDITVEATVPNLPVGEVGMKNPLVESEAEPIELKLI